MKTYLVQSPGLRTREDPPVELGRTDPACPRRPAPAGHRAAVLQHTLRIGHRGAAGYRPENTVRSVRTAIALGVDFVEVDVRRSRDGHLVVVHDPAVDRTTNGTGAVAEMTLRQLRRLDAGDAEPIPTLEEVLEVAAGRAGLVLEIKAEALGEQVYWTVAKVDFDGPVLYASFLHEEVLAIRRMDQRALGMALIDGVPIQPTAFARDARATHVGISLSSATHGFVHSLRADGFAVLVYTANEPDEIDRARSLAVDGIISDFPDRI